MDLEKQPLLPPLAKQKKASKDVSLSIRLPEGFEPSRASMQVFSVLAQGKRKAAAEKIESICRTATMEETAQWAGIALSCGFPKLARKYFWQAAAVERYKPYAPDMALVLRLNLAAVCAGLYECSLEDSIQKLDAGALRPKVQTSEEADATETALRGCASYLADVCRGSPEDVVKYAKIAAYQNCVSPSAAGIIRLRISELHPAHKDRGSLQAALGAIEQARA